MRNRVFISLIAVSIAGSGAVPAMAETTAGEGEGADPIVVTASRVTSEAREIGSSVSVVTRDDLQAGQITFTKDALLDVPGVMISSDRPGDYTTVSIRGSGNDEVLWLVDGIKLGDPSATSTQFQPDHLTSADISRVEVLRGNQSSLYGSEAIGGVINILTRRATQDGWRINAEGEGGSYGTVSGGATLLGKSGPLDFRVTATGYNHDGPSEADPRTFTPPAATAEDDRYWRYGFSGRIGYQINRNVSLQVTGFWQDSSSDLDNTTADSSDTVRKREYAFAGQAVYKSDDGKWKADLTGSRYNARRLYFGDYYSPDGDLYDGSRDEIALNLGYGGSGPVSVTVGGNYEWQYTNQATYFSGNFDQSVHTGSAYGEVALRPLAGLTITGAARLDDNSRFGTFDTYRGTIAYVLGRAKLRASYGTGAKAPGLYQLFDPSYGNPNLKAETSHGGDVGIDFAVNDKLTAQLTYFFNHKKNEITFDATRPPFGGYSQYGRTRAQGVELGLVLKPTAWLSVNQSFTYIDHKVDDSPTGDQPYVDAGWPTYSGTTAVTVSPIKRASLTIRARYRDGDSSGYGGTTRPYAVVDLLGSYRLTDQVELYARVVNLFDKWYQMSYGTQTLGLSAYGGIRIGL